MSSPEEFPDVAFFAEVGALCATWAFLESTLQRSIWRLLAIDEEMGRYVTYPLDAKRRWEMLCELAEKNRPDFHKDLKSKNQLMADITRDRNLIVHGVLRKDALNEHYHWVVFKGAMAGVPQPASEAFVAATRQKIRNLGHHILEQMGFDATPP